MRAIIIINAVPALICLLTAIIFYKRLQLWLRLFFYFLLITFIVDIGATIYSSYFKQSNHFIANIFYPISFTCYFLLFYKATEAKKIKKIVLASFIFYMLFVFYDMIYINGLYYINSYSYSVGSILILLCCMLYFMWLFASDSLINYFRTPMFWIATGLLFYFVGNLVQMSLFHYILSLDPGGIIYSVISLTLTVLLYGSFTIAFLCNQVWKKAR